MHEGPNKGVHIHTHREHDNQISEEKKTQQNYENEHECKEKLTNNSIINAIQYDWKIGYFTSIHMIMQVNLIFTYCRKKNSKTLALGERGRRKMKMKLWRRVRTACAHLWAASNEEDETTEEDYDKMKRNRAICVVAANWIVGSSNLTLTVVHKTPTKCG